MFWMAEITQRRQFYTTAVWNTEGATNFVIRAILRCKELPHTGRWANSLCIRQSLPRFTHTALPGKTTSKYKAQREIAASSSWGAFMACRRFILQWKKASHFKLPRYSPTVIHFLETQTRLVEASLGSRCHLMVGQSRICSPIKIWEVSNTKLEQNSALSQPCLPDTDLP